MSSKHQQVRPQPSFARQVETGERVEYSRTRSSQRLGRGKLLPLDPMPTGHRLISRAPRDLELPQIPKANVIAACNARGGCVWCRFVRCQYRLARFNCAVCSCASSTANTSRADCGVRNATGHTISAKDYKRTSLGRCRSVAVARIRPLRGRAGTIEIVDCVPASF